MASNLGYEMAMALITMVYVSSAVQLMSPAELLELLRISRERNRVVQVTGLLLYRDGNFMQVLEGDEQIVDSLQERIRRDPRHRGMICLLRQRLAVRAFGDWNMGFRNLHELDEREQANVSSFLAPSFAPEHWSALPDKAMTLLLRFRQDQR